MYGMLNYDNYFFSFSLCVLCSNFYENVSSVEKLILLALCVIIGTFWLIVESRQYNFCHGCFNRTGM